MRLLHPRRDLSLTTLSLLLLLPTTTAINLSQFQPISGFPPACTYAYNAELNNCFPTDFQPTHGCSEACIEGLQTETAFLQSACAGISAPQTELIGKFLAGNGISAVCRQPVTTTILQTTILQTTFGGFSTGTSATSASVVTAETSSSSAAVASSSSSTVSTAAVSSSSSTSFFISSPSPSSTISTSQSTAAASSSTSTPSTTSTPASSSSIPSAIPVSSASSPSSTTLATPTFIKTAVNKGTAVIFTSKAEQTASNNPDAFGGGGSPFEVGVVASSASLRGRNFALMMVGLVGWALVR